ncbi:MAG: hypothetical protein ACRD29_00715 [Acidimicrobiales bacterium]
MTRTVHVDTELPTDADRVWSAMKHQASFLYVARGLFGMPALTGRTEPVRPGESGTGWLFAFHVLPAYRHTIEVVEVDDATRTIRSHEYGGVLRRWDHVLHVEPVAPGRCRYSDTVTIDAGPLTPLVAFVSVGIYRYRQRRWHLLVSKHLLPSGPRYARTR